MTGLAFGDFMDGGSARVQRVALRLDPPEHPMDLELALPDGTATLRWPLSDIRHLVDQAEPGAVVLTRSQHPMQRLITDDAELIATLSDLAPDYSAPLPAPGMVKRLLGLGTAAVASVALIIFVLIPVMADQLAAMLPASGERALGDSTLEQIREALSDNDLFPIRTCQQPDGLAALAKMQARLEPATDFPYPIRLHVFDHEMVNAFALPGGHIILFRGLLEDAKSPEEIAGVLAHEMGHVEHRDPSRLALRSAGSIGVLGLLLGDFAGGTIVLFLAEQLISANHSRAAEAGADDYAHDVLSQSGLPTTPLADFFQRLYDEYGEETGLISHLASHPNLAGRADAARDADQTGGAYETVLSDAEWQAMRRMCR